MGVLGSQPCELTVRSSAVTVLSLLLTSEAVVVGAARSDAFPPLSDLRRLRGARGGGGLSQLNGGRHVGLVGRHKPRKKGEVQERAKVGKGVQGG